MAMPKYDGGLKGKGPLQGWQGWEGMGDMGKPLTDASIMEDGGIVIFACIKSTSEPGTGLHNSYVEYWRWLTWFSIFLAMAKNIQ